MAATGAPGAPEAAPAYRGTQRRAGVNYKWLQWRKNSHLAICIVVLVPFYLTALSNVPLLHPFASHWYSDGSVAAMQSPGLPIGSELESSVCVWGHFFTQRSNTALLPQPKPPIVCSKVWCHGRGGGVNALLTMGAVAQLVGATCGIQLAPPVSFFSLCGSLARMKTQDTPHLYCAMCRSVTADNLLDKTTIFAPKKS